MSITIVNVVIMKLTSFLTIMPTPKNTQHLHRSNRLRFLAYLLSACFSLFSSRIMQIAISLYLLTHDTEFCLFCTIVLKIFGTFSHHLSHLELLQLLRKCDILRLSSKIYKQFVAYTPKTATVFLCMLIYYYVNPI